MTDFNRTESARFAQENQKIVGELHAGADKALAEAASRGFAVAPGDTLAAILAAGQAAKDKLVEGNAKIYDDRRKVLFEQDEFAMKLIVSLAKLGMELYREELMNALAIEQAENTALRDLDNADVARMNAEVDLRQRAIIQARAEAERRVVVLKAALVAAEEGTLPYETALVNAQLATAEKKLEIIASIYLVLAAEELVLAAENRRAASLTLLLDAQMIVAEIKKQMIPFWIGKANARIDLAAAITAEIPISKAIIELGYDRIALEDRKEAAAHYVRGLELGLEVLKEQWTRANKATELSRAESRRLLQTYANITQAEIMANKKSLNEDGIDIKLKTGLARQAIGVDDDEQVTNAEKDNTTEELAAVLLGLDARAHAQANSIDASKEKHTRNESTTLLSRKIIEGVF